MTWIVLILYAIYYIAGKYYHFPKDENLAISICFLVAIGCTWVYDVLNNKIKDLDSRIYELEDEIEKIKNPSEYEDSDPYS